MNMIAITDVKDRLYLYNPNRITKIACSPAKNKDTYEVIVTYVNTETDSRAITDKLHVQSKEDIKLVR